MRIRRMTFGSKMRKFNQPDKLQFNLSYKYIFSFIHYFKAVGFSMDRHIYGDYITVSIHVIIRHYSNIILKTNHNAICRPCRVGNIYAVAGYDNSTRCIKSQSGKAFACFKCIDVNISCFLIPYCMQRICHAQNFNTLLLCISHCFFTVCTGKKRICIRLLLRISAVFYIYIEKCRSVAVSSLNLKGCSLIRNIAVSIVKIYPLTVIKPVSAAVYIKQFFACIYVICSIGNLIYIS